MPCVLVYKYLYNNTKLSLKLAGLVRVRRGASAPAVLLLIRRRSPVVARSDRHLAAVRAYSGVAAAAECRSLVLPPPKSRPEPRTLSAPSLGNNPWRPMPPRRPRLIKGLPAPRALSSSRRIVNKILRETVIYWWGPKRHFRRSERSIPACGHSMACTPIEGPTL